MIFQSRFTMPEHATNHNHQSHDQTRRQIAIISIIEEAIMDQPVTKKRTTFADLSLEDEGDGVAFGNQRKRARVAKRKIIKASR
mmetsp:Transcript_15445/g.32497  ORF Transcript_15445/g.32497 Transcript_15445/m.32497 type:complete len:84 (+) Transcript_15445:178-429(+)